MAIYFPDANNSDIDIYIRQIIHFNVDAWLIKSWETPFRRLWGHFQHCRLAALRRSAGE